MQFSTFKVSPGYPIRKTLLYLMLVVLFFVILSSSELFAQRITYESLRMRDRQPHVFIEHLVLPGFSTDERSLVTTFRLENNFLTFRRYRDDQSREEQRNFFAEPVVRLTIRKANGETESQTNPPPVATSTWNEEVFTNTYEQTQSTTSFVQNIIQTQLPAGQYNIEAITTSDNRSRRDVTPAVRIADTTATDIAYFYFLDEQSGETEPGRAPLMNMGRNVYFGRDHQLLIWFPGMEQEAGYKLEIQQLRIQQRDTTVVKRVLEHPVDKEELLYGYQPEVGMVEDRPHLELHEADNTPQNGIFYLLHIPNSTFANAHYRARLLMTTDDDNEETIAERTYQSLWLDMPVSLLNIDVAISMMEFIVDDETHRSLRRGSREEKEQRFQEFWKKRDPSPESEYNELMVEYFRRIDYAYEHFTTPQVPGYESDQGKVYVRHGEPDKRERTFPPNQPAREIWHYSDRTFVFEATSGFGDYRLIERK